MYTKTKNISFKKMREFLQNGYIENNEFMMQVNHEELKEFDLSKLYEMEEDERKAMINLINEECAENIWFFFREILPDISPVSEDDSLYNLSEMPRFRLTVLSMIMIYMYDNNKNFAIQRMYDKAAQDKEAMLVADKTLAMLALYEFLYKSNDPTIFSIAESKDTTLFSYIMCQYNKIMDVTSKGLIQQSDFIHNGNNFPNDLKFFEIGIDTDYYSMEILDGVRQGKRNFFGIIDHIYDIDSIVGKSLEKVPNEKVMLISSAIKEFKDNTFSYRYIKNEFIENRPATVVSKYYFDRIFDNQGPIPHSENIITVL